MAASKVDTIEQWQHQENDKTAAAKDAQRGQMGDGEDLVCSKVPSVLTSNGILV